MRSCGNGTFEKQQKRAADAALSRELIAAEESALTSLESRIALADHEHFAATTHNLAVTVPRLGGLQRGKHLHGRLLKLTKEKYKNEIVTGLLTWHKSVITPVQSWRSGSAGPPVMGHPLG